MPPAIVPKVIAITGTIGSGKSLVGKILAERNIPVIDSDQVVHDLLSTNKPLQKAITDRFGQAITLENNGIDRDKLGAIVFTDETSRRDLELLVHPAVISEINRQLERLSGEPLAAVLAPLLFEAGLSGQYDEIWAVVAAEPVIRSRLKRRDNLSDREIDCRLSAQWSQEEKAARCHSIIDNSGTIEDTRHQVETLLSRHYAS